MFSRLLVETNCSLADAVALFSKLAKIIKPELIETGGDIRIELRGTTESILPPDLNHAGTSAAPAAGPLG